MKEITLPEREKFYNEHYYKNTNLFIEAGAGAGKTNTLVRKIIDQLIQGIIPSRFVVITFTNKATEEMRSRINEDINKAKNNVKDYTPDQLKIISEASKTLDKMQISTIHSFCNRILNEYSFDAGISYGAELLEEDDEDKRKDLAFYKWKKQLSNAELCKIEAYNELSLLDDKSSIIDMIKNSYNELCDQFDSASINTNFNFRYSEAFNIATEVANIILKCSGDFNLKNNDIIPLHSFLSGFDLTSISSDTVENRVQLAIILKRLADNRPTKFVKNSTGYLEYNNKKDNLKKWKILTLTSYLEIVNEYALKAWNYYKTEIDKETLTNNQLIFKCYELIEKNPEIAKKIAQNIDTIYVDEFQDTDEFQIKFIKAIGLEIVKRKFENNEPKSMSMFIVGDPKQSIYRFRGADIATYTSVKNEWDSLGSKIDATLKDDFLQVFLPDNFRSNNLIVSYVNDTFKTKDLGNGCTYSDMVVPKEHEVKNPSKDPNILGGVYSYPFYNEDQKEKKFNNLVHLIKYLKENDYQIYAPDEKDKNNRKFVLRPIRYNDFLILTCSKTDIATYAEHFAAAGIPLNIQGNFSLGSSEILRINCRILNYLLNGTVDNLKMVESIVENYFEAPGVFLKKLVEETKTLTPYAKILFVLRNFKDLILENFDSSAELAYKSASQQLFEKLCVNENTTSSELNDRINELLLEYEDSEIMLEKNADAVRIMNFHKSKGLEGEIVIIPNSGGFKNGEHLSEANKEKYLNCLSLPGFEEKNDIKKQEIEAERTRLEYVAVTRAQQVLIYDSDFKNPTNSKHAFAFLGTTINSDFKNYQIENGLLPNQIDVEKYALSLGKKPINPSKLSMSIKEKVNPENLVSNLEETSPSRLENKNDENKSTVFFAKRPVGNIFGNCLHRAMELYALSKGKRKIEQIISQTINENSNYINDFDQYEKYLSKCVASIASYYEREKVFENALEINPEFTFLTIENIDSKEKLLSGSIDLLLINKDGSARIIDYKSDISGFTNEKQFEDKLKTIYSPELLAYQSVVSKLFNLPKDNIAVDIIWIEERGNDEFEHHFSIL